MPAGVTTDRAEARKRRRRAARQMAVRYALIYAAASVVWIVALGPHPGLFGLPHDVELVLASVKGIALRRRDGDLLLLFLGLRYFRNLELSQERYTRLFENAIEGLTVFTVVRDADGAITDLELVDMNPTQQERTGLTREEAVGRRLSRPDGLDERTRSYLEVVASAADGGTTARSELFVESEDAYELLEAYPVGRDRWALSALDITGVRHAERALRQQEENIRRAYVDVLDAVTGGKLILLTDEELAGQLGVPLMKPGVRHRAARSSPRRARRSRRAAAEHFPDWAPARRRPHAGRRGARQRPPPRRRRHLPAVRARGDAAGHGPRRRPGHRLPHAAPGHAAARLLHGVEPRHGLHDHAAGAASACCSSTRPGRTSVVLEFAARSPPRGCRGRGLVRVGPPPAFARRGSGRPHAVVARLVLHLGEPERLEHRRDVVGEPPAQSLLEAVPAADRVVGGPAPGLHGAFRRRLCSSALPSGTQSPAASSMACRSSMQRRW